MAHRFTIKCAPRGHDEPSGTVGQSKTQTHGSRHQSKDHQEARDETREARAFLPKVVNTMIRIERDVKDPDDLEQPIPDSKPADESEGYKEEVPRSPPAPRSLPRSRISLMCSVDYAAHTRDMSAQRMAAKLRPRVMLPESCRAIRGARQKPAAVSFGGVLGSCYSVTFQPSRSPGR